MPDIIDLLKIIVEYKESEIDFVEYKEKSKQHMARHYALWELVCTTPKEELHTLSDAYLGVARNGLWLIDAHLEYMRKHTSNDKVNIELFEKQRAVIKKGMDEFEKNGWNSIKVPQSPDERLREHFLKKYEEK